MKTRVTYKVRNWQSYNKALVNRGNICLWLEEDVLKKWLAVQSGKLGRPFIYSDLCIELALNLRALFSLPLRSTQGFLASFLKLLSIKLPVPNYTTLSRRASELKMILSSKKKISNIIVDSTGLKIYGEGEWKTRIHGKGKRRIWRKLHLAMDGDSFEIVAMELIKANCHDDTQTVNLLEGFESVKNFFADGAYLSKKTFDRLAELGARPRVPLRTGTCPVEKDPSSGELLRNELIKEIREAGGKSDWKKESDYHKRSLIETQMFRFKNILGNKLQNRNFGSQMVEAQIKCKLLNKMTRLGMPDSYKVLR